MTLHPAMPMDYAHERYFGRPSCPRCGKLVIAPETSEYMNRGQIRSLWACDKCDHTFQTLIESPH